MAVQITHACKCCQSCMQSASLSYAAAVLPRLQSPRSVQPKKWRRDHPFAWMCVTWACKYKNHSFCTWLHVSMTFALCKITVWWHEIKSLYHQYLQHETRDMYWKWHYLFCSGELEVAAEFNTTDSDAAGSVDFVVLLNSFVISVLEVRTLFCHSCASLLCIPNLGVNVRQLWATQQW